MKTLVEQYLDDPYLSGIQRIIFDGKTCAELLDEKVTERDKQKEIEIILCLFATGMDVKAIAAAFKKDVKYIEEVILEAQKHAVKRTSI